VGKREVRHSDIIKMYSMTLTFDLDLDLNLDLDLDMSKVLYGLTPRL